MLLNWLYTEGFHLMHNWQLRLHDLNSHKTLWNPFNMTTIYQDNPRETAPEFSWTLTLIVLKVLTQNLHLPSQATFSV